MNLVSVAIGHDPDKVCLIDSFGELTYRGLLSLATSWVTYFKSKSVGVGDRVALITQNDRRFVAPYLGALSLGAVVVPVNPLSPKPERDSELASVEPKVVIDGDELGVPTNFLDDPLETFVEMDPTDSAVLLFTSGTAGFPKAAILTHGSLRANLDQIAGYSTPHDVGLAVLPFFHVFGLNVVLNLGLLSGGTLRMDAMAPDVTVLAGVPAHYDAWAADEGFETPNVRLAICGGAPLSRETFDRFQDRFGIALYEGYGLTEASPVVTFPDFDQPAVFGSVGTPLDSIDLKIVDPDGQEVFEGDAGEVLVRGPNLFGGYYKNPQATERVIDADGWLHTGDIGVVGFDGKLHLVDRAKDLIIVSGFNVFPQEVEKIIESVPGVKEVAVAGHDRVNAYVVANNVTSNAITNTCREHLAAYKCPSSIVFVDNLPRAATGEVMRRYLTSPR